VHNRDFSANLITFLWLAICVARVSADTLTDFDGVVHLSFENLPGGELNFDFDVNVFLTYGDNKRTI
jgi:hypothetical protein